MARLRAYLDYNAGAPLRPEARAAMVAALDAGGNASSVHGEGRAARARVEAARAAVAGLVGAEAKRVTFVSGGTEANITALTPALTVGGRRIGSSALLVSATEHVSVLSGGRFAAEHVRAIPVDGEGIVDLDALRLLLAEAPAPVLVSVMLANNETGAIQPVAAIAGIVHEAGGVLHCDAAQAAGRIPVDLPSLGADLLTLSAHKLGGPQGAGAIVLGSDAVSVPPLLRGGGQERYLRAGTENVAAIAGFGAAASAASRDFAATAAWPEWRSRIEASVAAVPRATHILSAGADRLNQTVCAAVEGVAAETLLIALDLAGIAVSSGSACSSGKVSPSHVLAAMGRHDLQRSAIRISFGWATTEADLDLFDAAWTRAVGTIAAGRDMRAA